MAAEPQINVRDAYAIIGKDGNGNWVLVEDGFPRPCYGTVDEAREALARRPDRDFEQITRCLADETGALPETANEWLNSDGKWLPI